MRQLLAIPLLLAPLALTHVACSGDPSDQLRGPSTPRPSSPDQGAGSNANASGGSSSGESSSSSGGGSSSSSGGSTSSSSGGSSSSSGGHDAGVDSAPSDPLASARALCVKTINDYRATVGSPPLQQWTAEEKCVDGQAMSDATSGTAHGAFGTCNEFAQDECPGWPGPPDQLIVGCLKAMWDEGPGGGHYENMKNAQSTKAACGFYQTTDGSWWATQNFAP